MATLSPDPSVPPPPRLGWLGTTFRALRHPNYRLYFLGQIVSLTGMWVQMAAQSWLAYELTGQSRWPALISAAQVLPTLVLGIYGGSLADRFPRRWLIFLTQSAMLLLALLLAGLVVLDSITPEMLLALSLALGIVNALDTPARLAFVMDMVGRDDIVNAVALNSLVFNVARAIGPAIGGELLEAYGAAACFLVNALTFLALLAGLLAMRLPPTQKRADQDEGSFRAGALLHLWNNPALILLLAIAGALAFFGWPLLALLPALADQQLHTDKIGYARLLSGVGTGALLGALLVAGLGKMSRRRSFLAAGVITATASLLGLSATSHLWVAVAWCALSGCGLILFFATGQAIMQLGAGEHNRGTIMGIWLMILSGAQPAGNLAAGFLADRLGVSPVLLLEGIGIGAAGLLVLLVALVARLRWRPL